MTNRRPRPARMPVAAVAAFAAIGALALGGLAALPWLARRVGLRRVEVAGESMSPALQPGDFVILRRGAPPPGREYGRIVTVRDPRPEGDGRLLLKRIVGLPGESLRVGGGPVHINGHPLFEPYASGEGPAEQHRGINRLEANELFVIGDRRSASTDSRDFGPVRRDGIEATAVSIYWPPARIGWLRPPRRQFASAPEAPPAASPSPHDAPIPILRADRRMSDESGNS